MKRIIHCFTLILVACGSTSSDGAETAARGSSSDVGDGISSGIAATTSGGGVSGGSSESVLDAGSVGVGGVSGGGGGSALHAGSGGVGGTSTAGHGGASNGSGGSAQGGNAEAGTPGGSSVSVKCETPVGPGLPSGAPALQAGTWTAINPAGFPFDENTSTLGVAVDPCNRAVLYVCTGSYDTSIGGLYKSINAGSSWTRIGHIPIDYTGTDHVEAPLHVRIDPQNTQHLYVVQGVRGHQGFYVSTDGGENLKIPQGFATLSAPGFNPNDVYSIAVDPTDFAHVLLSFHGAWGWTDTKWNTSSGVLESKDGGDSWIVHEPNGWGTGHTITFLYDPELGIGNANTWLLGTQGNGMLRTTNAGATWTKVTDNGIQHGGGTVYYTHNGDLYASGADHNAKSTDNGATWTIIGPGGGYNAIGGDGRSLYTAKCFGPTPFIVSSETDGVTWNDFSSQQFGMGMFDIKFDATNRILYSSNWRAGLYALKLQ